MRRIGRFVLAAALFAGLSVTLWSQDDDDLVAHGSQGVQVPTRFEIDAYAGIRVVVIEQQLELRQTLAEIAGETGLSGREITRAQQALDAAGGDPQAVHAAYLADDRYSEAITRISIARREMREAINRAVAGSILNRNRFDELTIIISHDRRLAAQANTLVAEKLAEAGLVD